jgi:hypothetical protein
MTHAPLPADAWTAFRLATDGSGQAPLARVLAIWRVLRADPAQPIQLEDLPDGMRRLGDRVVVDEPLEPLTLGNEEILAESLRLAALHRTPDADGWMPLSNVMRVFSGLTRREGPRPSFDKGPSRWVREHPLLEVRNVDNDMQVRIRVGGPAPDPVVATTAVTCPGDEEPRMLAERTTLGVAYQALLGMPRDLIADGTTAVVARGEDRTTVTYDATTRTWRTPDGERLGRMDTRDPIVHEYANGLLVGCVVGFPSISPRGLVFASVGVPYDSHGDDDASVDLVDSRRAESVEEALELLRGRGDLDRIFTRPVEAGRMGFWLSQMGDA